MSTFQKAHESVSRRRASLGGDMRVATTPAASLATASPTLSRRSSSAQQSPVWDGRINVEAKRRVRLFTQASASPIATPSITPATASDTDAYAKKPAKKKKAKTTRTTATSAASTKASSLTSTGPKNKMKKKPSVESILAASSTSLSTTPVTTTRSTMPLEASEERWRVPVRGFNSSNTSNTNHNHHHDGDDEGHNGLLEISSQTSSEDSDIDFEVEETPTSGATPTSRAVSSAAAVAAAALSAPATVASRTPAESIDWLRLSSQPVSLQDNGLQQPSEVSVRGQTSPRSLPCSPNRTAPSSLSSSSPPSPPPAQHTSEDNVAAKAQSSASVASSKMDAAEGKDGGQASSSSAALPAAATKVDDAEVAVLSSPAAALVDAADTVQHQELQCPSPAESPIRKNAESTPQAALQVEATAALQPTSTVSVVAEDEKRLAEAAYDDATDITEATHTKAQPTTTPTPPEEAPTVQLPRYMTGTSVRPVVGVTTASPSSPSPSISRARARLASAPALQQPSSPQLPSPQPEQQRPSTPPPTAAHTTATTSTTMLRRTGSGTGAASSGRAEGISGPSPHHRSPSFSSPLTHATASPARFSRTSSLAECSPVENSVARRRARLVAVAAAAAQHGNATTNSEKAAVQRSASEPINARAYEERQRHVGRPARDAFSTASARSSTPGATSRASPPPPPAQHDRSFSQQQQQQQPTVMSIALMDGCIYHAVMVDPPNVNERVEMPPVMERPLSFYEQGMYNRHKENAPAHYKKALVHEQHALLRNTAWLPVATMLDQRSGGVGAMMLDDFRHMARVIRYAQELENWKGALTQRAKYDAQCTELMQAAAMRSSTLMSSLKSTSDAASPKAASPSVHRDNYHGNGVYRGEDADAQEMSTATAAMGEAGATPTAATSLVASVVRAASPSPHKPSAAATATTANHAASVCAASTAAAHPHKPTHASPSGNGWRKASVHNPDYSDSDVDEEKKGTATLAKPTSTVATSVPTAPSTTRAESAATRTKLDVSVNASGKTTATATPASAMATKRAVSAPGATAGHHASAKPPTTKDAAASAKKPVEKSKSQTAKEKEMGKDKKTKKEKEKSESPTFLTWLADAFGVKNSKKDEASKKKLAAEKTPHAAHKPKAEGKSTATKSKSAAKSEPTTAAAATSPKKSSAKTTAPAPGLTRTVSAAPSSQKPTVTKAASEPAALKQPPQQPQKPTATATTRAAPVSLLHAPNVDHASPSPQHSTGEGTNRASLPADDSHTTDVRVKDAAASAPSTDACSPFTEDLHVSRFQARSARCCSVELPPAPIPVFRLYNFHPLEVVQELKRMTWWAAIHRFFVFRVLTGASAAARTAEAARLHGVRHAGDGDDEGGDHTCSESRQRARRMVPGAAAATHGGGRCAASSITRSGSPAPTKDDGLCPCHGSSSSSLDSCSPSHDSFDAAAAGTHHEAVYFNTVLLNLRIDRWLVRRVVLTRRDAALGLVELEITEVAEDEAAEAAERDMETREAMTASSAQAAMQRHGISNVADRHVASAMTYFFSSDTRTPR